MSKIEKVLIITSSGGGGLLQAANAKEQEIKAKNPNAIVIQRDVMSDWMWKGIGKFFTRAWNGAQINGNVWMQTLFGTIGHRLIDYFFWPHIFVCSLYTLFKEDVDRVLDTQIMGTSAVLKALRLFNKRKNKKIHLEKVLVDLPTKKATHFFLPIKALSKKDRKLFKLITVMPLLEKGQTQEEFWVKNCNLTSKQLQYEDYYVRKGFWKFRNLERKAEPIKIRTRYQSNEELGLILQTIDRGMPKYTIQGSQLEFTIDPCVQVYTILLGSQPASDATLNYIRKFIEISKGPIHLFVFLANHRPGQNSLFKKVTSFIQEVKDYPKHLTIIPMSFQQDDTLGPLFFRSDITCTRSGGQTAMELMCANRGQIWIHSESKKTNPTEDDYLKGIPAWESANAVYLQQFKNAKLVTPDTFNLLVQ